MEKVCKLLGTLAAIVEKGEKSDLFLSLPNGELIKLEDGNLEREKITDFFKELESTSYKDKTIILAERNGTRYLLVYQDHVDSKTMMLVLVESIKDGDTFVLSKDGEISFVQFLVVKLGIIQGDGFEVMASQTWDTLD